MWFFARLGVPAPRESHALVYVNGEFAGVLRGRRADRQGHEYARVFGHDGDGNQNDGYLYEFNKADEWWLSYSRSPSLDRTSATSRPRRTRRAR
jgi:hypothetical protein